VKIDYTRYPLPRIRRHANPVLYFPAARLKGGQLNYPYPHKIKLQWSSVFGNSKPPDYIDIGSGIGKFLIEMAMNYPDKNILGFEIRKAAVEWTNNVLGSERILNGKVLWYSVVNGFDFICDASVEKIFYLFPDPWFKKRHKKRRAFSIELLEEFYRILKSGGMLYTATDIDELDTYHTEITEKHEKFKVYEGEWDICVRTPQEEFCIRKNISYKRRIYIK
jgi:tRNA (guanine-N7-)-methyltransferase